MKVLVVGLGSMGQRRIRLLQKYNPNFHVIGVDANASRVHLCGQRFKIETYIALDDAIKKHRIDVAFVCAAPLAHNEIIKKCLRQKYHVFTELNLVSDGYCENINIAKKNQLVVYVSSTLQHREEIQRIKSLVNDKDCHVNYNYHVGQYLPDWHPWERYQDFFVSDKLTNGCRELFAIELPWLIDVFGRIEKVDVIKDKMSDLQIDYCDNYLLILQHFTGNKGMLAVDVVSRKAVRNFEVFGENLHLQWDGSPTGLREYDIVNKKDRQVALYNDIDRLNGYSASIIENAYMNEIIDFFEVLNGNKETYYTLEDDWCVLKIIDYIEA